MNNPITKISSIIIALLTALSVSCAEEVKALKVGDTAPLVGGKNQEGQEWKLADALKQHAVLLYFYPKDDTPGCTKEACGFRDNIGILQRQGVEVLGVSFDDAESHKKFIEKHNLNFSLLADTDGKIADAFGVRAPGRDRARRVSFLIGKDGKIAHITDSGNAQVHLDEMKEAVGRLSKD